MMVTRDHVYVHTILNDDAHNGSKRLLVSFQHDHDVRGAYCSNCAVVRHLANTHCSVLFQQESEINIGASGA